MTFEEFYADCDQVIDRYFQSGRIFSFPFSTLPTEAHGWGRGLFVHTLAGRLENRLGFEYSFALCYDNETVYMVREDTGMTSKITIEIPYESRSKYLDTVLAINRLVPKEPECCVALYVDNNPYSLASYLVVETTANFDEIRMLVGKAGLHTTAEKGLEEFNAEMNFRRWNACIFSQQDHCVLKALQTLYIFSEKETLEKKGFQTDEIKKLKIFISYCHADKQTVLNAVDLMERRSLDIWIDKKEIDLGDHILESIVRGIKQCDLAVLFISNATLRSFYQQKELRDIMNNIIRQGQHWCIVKLDEVDPDEVFPSLGDYLYYDFPENPDMEMLVDSIEKKIQKIRSLC